MIRKIAVLSCIVCVAGAPPARLSADLDALQNAATEQQAGALEERIVAAWHAQLTPSVQLLVEKAVGEIHAGKPRDAVDDFNAAIALQPGTADLWRMRAEARYAAGDENGAVADLAQALSREVAVFSCTRRPLSFRRRTRRFQARPRRLAEIAGNRSQSGSGRCTAQTPAAQGIRTARMIRPSQAHATLGAEFFDVVEPARFPLHILRYRNQEWAARVGLDGLSDTQWVDHFGRFQPIAGSFEQPLALRYHGHQFGQYNPELGDGRGFLFAQLYDLDDGRLLDLGTKGSGQTPWSRTADGRLTLKGGIREILTTSMLEALGVETSKTFSLIETGEDLFRGDEPSPTRSSVMVRLNHSHIRIGSFQRLAYLQDVPSLRTLLDYTVRTYFPECWRENEAERAAAFLAEVCRRCAKLGAQWMLAGFVHGVLNTDNINVTGESFDYGPWRFLPTYDPKFTAAYFDHSGLYAYGRQPDTLAWNLARLAECLLPLAPQAALEAGLSEYAPSFRSALRENLYRRLGLRDGGQEGLNDAVWRFLQESQAPFERFFFDWYGGTAREASARHSPSAPHYETEAFAPVRKSLAEQSAAANSGHVYFSAEGPCTMLVEDVEALWAPIAERDDWSAFAAKLDDIAQMKEALGTQA